MMTTFQRALLFALAAGALPAQDPEIRLIQVAAGLTSPVDIQSAKDGSGRLFIVQQNGLIRLLHEGALATAPFLDIQSRTRSNGECGLLGLAFPPGFREKRYFYVNYTDTGCVNSIVARYRVSGSSPDRAEASSEQVLLTLRQPFTNHNGGQLQFGPDGFLYIGFGDGGSGGDPQNNAQNPQSLLGKMLRLDTESGGAPYRIPPSNPFVGDARFRPEIWASGLRNPWRFSFDRETGDLWIGDVGQNRAEEIDFQSALSQGGENYGWRTMEGMQCFNPPDNCNRNGLTPPVYEYTRGQGDISVTGGYVYRGSRWPALRGTYFYADYATGRIWGMRREGPLFNSRLLLRPQATYISTFGEDEAGELYLAHHGGGVVYRIEGYARPAFTARSVLNAASFEPGLTPGSAATLFAAGITTRAGIVQSPNLPLRRELAGLSVLINGVDVPLYAVAYVNGQEQVNFQMPFNWPGPRVRMSVLLNGVASQEVEVPVAEFQPGVFAANGEAIVVDALANTLARTVRGGQLVYFYATGLGPVSNQPLAGSASPSAPLARVLSLPVVTIGGVTCELQFAGLAPGFAGIYQVNIRIPGGLSRGVQELVATAGGVRGRAAPVTVE